MKRPEEYTQKGFWRLTLFSLFGPIVWAGHLGLVYGAQHVVCAVYAPGTDGIFVLFFTLGVTFAALSALALFGSSPAFLEKIIRPVRLDPPVADFLTAMARLLAGLSFFGVLWAGSAVFFLSECPAWR